MAVTKDIVLKRLERFIQEVHDPNHHRSLKPDESWWVISAFSYKNLTPSNAVTIEKQLGFTAEDMKKALGSKWRSKLVKENSGTLYQWPAGKFSPKCEYVCVRGAAEQPDEPVVGNIVTSVSSTLARVLKNHAPVGPVPGGMAREDTEDAAKKIAEMRKYQKGLQNGILKAEEYEQALKLLQSGQLEPNDIMKKTAYAVVKGATDKNGVATIIVPRMISKKNGATVNTKMRLLVLPASKVKEDSSKSVKNRAAAQMKVLIGELYASTNEKAKGMKKVAQELGFDIIDAVQKMTIPQVLAFRRYCRFSDRQVSKVGRFLRHIGIIEGLIPRMQNVTDYEKERQHPFCVKNMHLFISSGDKDSKHSERKSCTVWYVTRPAGILEDLVCSAKLANKWQESIDISNMEDVIFAFMGLDKAGDEITNMIRTGNRYKGNHGTCCQPFARAEDGAAENTYNCGKFFYSPNYPMQEYQQHLLDNKLHMIVVEVRSPRGELVDCRATTVQFEDLTSTSDKAKVEYDYDDDVSNTVTLDEASIPGDLAPWTKTMTGRFKLAIDEEGFAVGIVNEADTSKLIAWRNNITLPLDPSAGEVSIVCRRLVGFLSHDTKQGLIVAGIGSASSSCPCLHCLQHRKYFKLLPPWMGEMDPTIPRDQLATEEPMLRVGEDSVTNMHNSYVASMENNPSAIRSETRHRHIKVEYGSCVHQPGLDASGDKDTMGPLHMSSGVFTHHTCGTRKKIRAVEENNPWLQHVRAIRAEAEAFLEEAKNNEQRKINHNEVMKIENELKKVNAQKDTAEEEGDGAAVGGAEHRIFQLQQQLMTYTEVYGYADLERQVKGAEEMVSQIKSYLSSKSRKPRGRAEYRYNQGFEIKAKVFFRAEHSGFELSNADGIKALEKWSEICEYAIKSYDQFSNDANEQQMYDRIEKIMTDSKELSTPLLAVSKILKTQDKLDTDKINEFSRDLIKLSKAFRKIYKTFEASEESKDVFNKLHHLEYHVRPFMIKYGFYGRGSEEGKEQAHNEFASDMQIVSRQKCKERRVSSFLRRQNSAVSPELVPILQGLDPKKRGNGTYQPSNKRKHRRIENAYDEPTTDAGNEYLEVENTKTKGTYLIKKTWKEVYMMCAYGEVPEEWTR